MRILNGGIMQLSGGHSGRRAGGEFPLLQAVVIGSGIAGLTAARILADYAARVVVVERDHEPIGPAGRPGVPQANHPHNLQPQAQDVLERVFPGLTSELLDAQAVRLGGPGDIAFFYRGGWKPVQAGGRRASIASSRSLLEQTITRRVQAHPRIELKHGYEVAGLYTAEGGRAIGGVFLQPRAGTAGQAMALDGQIVVDASGRRSRAPEWLAELGFRPPEEWRIDAQVGYASRLYQRPADFDGRWKMLYIRPTPPDGTRGGLILPLEGDRWHVALMSAAGDYPPTDEAGFLEFAASLPAPELYEAIRDARPLGRIHGFRNAYNRVRRYDSLPRTLEGFLVIGDAAYALNPLYAQGMTAALLSCQALTEVLALQLDRPDGHIGGLALTFQRQLSRAVEGPWRQATRVDWRWDTTLIDDNTEMLLAAAG
jgi:flavin-dependent dehydrogenase